MKKYFRILSLSLTLLVSLLVLASCSDNKQPTSTGAKPQNVSYIKVDGNDLNKEYIGYFFYVAQRNMIQEAGMVLGDGGNSTKEDVDEFWKTTEIEGRKAVDVARDLAADNAVMQTVQYLKAVQEGITLSEEDKNEITAQIENAIASSGGQKAFEETLSQMGCSQDAYRQILTENVFVNKLYQKYDAEGKLDITPQELEAYMQNHGDKVAPEDMPDYAKKDKFNQMSMEWEKEFDIVIFDENMKLFEVK